MLGHAGGFFVLEPMASVREGEKLRVGTVPQAFLSHLQQEEGVALAPRTRACVPEKQFAVADGWRQDAKSTAVAPTDTVMFPKPLDWIAPGSEVTLFRAMGDGRTGLLTRSQLNNVKPQSSITRMISKRLITFILENAAWLPDRAASTGWHSI